MNSDRILIGVLSDTHISSSSGISSELKTALSEFDRLKINYLFHLGDFTNIGVYRQLVNKYGEERVIAVLGNMDGRNLELSSLLPEFRDLTLLGHHILLLHGWGAPIKIIERINKRYDTSEYDLIVFGHTHRHLLIQKGQKWYFNPGPCKARGSFGFIELTPDEIIPRIVQI
ncbi:MAG: metallophosphoesterase family protein [Promethearchaeota archaeon]